MYFMYYRKHETKDSRKDDDEIYFILTRVQLLFKTNYMPSWRGVLAAPASVLSAAISSTESFVKRIFMINDLIKVQMLVQCVSV
jgi:hypothetical protein